MDFFRGLCISAETHLFPFRDTMENKTTNNDHTTSDKTRDRIRAKILPPKGIRTRSPDMVACMSWMIQELRLVMSRYFVEERDYSTLEQTQHLLKKYGDDEKLIYELQDQGGQQLSLRYDLTTQHMLYERRQNSKTFQVGKVFRRENNSSTQNRFREFYQFDIDFKGIYPTLSLVEMFLLLSDCLRTVGLKKSEYKILVNSRVFIDNVLKTNKFPEELKASTCSSIDKIDKLGWPQVIKELCNKGISIDPQAFPLSFETSALPDSIQQLQQILEDYDIEIEWLPTLVRGISYYTHHIFEVVVPAPENQVSKDQVSKDTNSKSNATSHSKSNSKSHSTSHSEPAWTIAGGGEYDKDMIGFSLGLDRILSLGQSVQAFHNFKTMHEKIPKTLIAVGETCLPLAIQIAFKTRAQEPMNLVFIAKISKVKDAMSKIKEEHPNGLVCVFAEREMTEYNKTGTIQWK